MPLLAVYVTYQLDDERFWDTLHAAWITAEEAQERAQSGQAICRLVNASGPADETSLISTLLFYGYDLGELSENLPPDLSENLDRTASIRDIQEALSPLGDDLHTLRDTTVADINATVSDISSNRLPALLADLANIQGQQIPALRQDVVSINAILPDIQEDLLGISASISTINGVLDGKAGNSAASQAAAGLMSAADKKKLDGIAAGAQVNPAVATQAANGLLSAADKKKLDGIAAGAQVNPDMSKYLALTGGTLSGALTLATNNVARPLSLTLMQVDRAQNTDAGGSFVITDKNSALLAVMQWKRDVSGTNTLLFSCYNSNTAGSQVGGSLAVSVARDGTITCGARTPPAASNSTEIASTAWTRARIAAATGKGATTFSLNAETATMALNEQAAAFDLDDFCAWRPDMLTPDMLEAAWQVINDYSMQAIFYGFRYELNREDYFFSYDLYDQQNIADKALLALSGEAVSINARNESSEMVKLDLGSDEMAALHKYAVKIHKQGYMDLALERKKAIANQGSASALKERLDEYGLLDAFEEYMKSINSAYLNE